jgi:hypothetical protein
MVNTKKYLDRIKNPKEQEKEFSSWWKKSVKNFVPVRTQLFEQRRGPRVLQSLAVSEYEKSLVITRMGVDKDEALNYSQPGTGYIYLNFTDNDTENFKKMVAMHEASHLTLTPGPNELTSDVLDFVQSYKLLVNLLEDVRCNRYLCLKYPGMLRYFEAELATENHQIMTLSIGDLVGKELSDDEVPDGFEPFFDLKDDIRACTSFSDVIEIAKKLVDENQKQQQEDGDGYGQDGDGDSQAATYIINNNCGLTDKQKDGLSKASKENEKTARLMNTKRDEEEKSGIINVVHGDKVSIYKKDKSMFLGQPDSFSKATMSKHTMKMLMRDYSGWKNTREGRLNKINLSKLYSNGNMFRRRYFNRTMPKAYIVLDGSGSMYGESRSWQKGLTLGLISLFKELNVDSRVFIHSGDTGSFYYSELDEKDIKEAGAYCYTLDGSMLEALFENEIDPKERAIIFYFSDGQIPAQYPEIQVPLVEKYNMIAEKRGTPIFGIGLGVPGVDYFTHWHVVKGKGDFQKTLERIGKQLGKYM